MKTLITALSFLIAMTPDLDAQAPGSSRANHSRTITPTRQVAQFSELESQWLDAIQQKNQPALDHLLIDDFEILTPLAGNPVERDEFIEATTSLKLESYRISQMTVHDYGDTAAVNFFLTAKGQFRGRDAGGQYFIVDIWRKTGDSWQAAVRYLSKSGNALAARPTGKE